MRMVVRRGIVLAEAAQLVEMGVVQAGHGGLHRCGCCCSCSQVAAVDGSTCAALG